MKRARQIRFPSWSLFLSAALRPPVVPNPTSRESGHHALTFRGTDTFDQAMKLARDGWKNGALEAERVVAPMVAKIARRIQKTDVKHDVEGFTFDVSRYVEYKAGQAGPEYWLAWEERDLLDDEEVNEDVNRVVKVKIVVNTTPDAATPKELIAARGAWLAGIVRLMEYAGCRCEINAVFATYDPKTKQNLEIWTTVKELGQPLDLARLAFAVAHPAKTRRLDLAVMEGLPAPDSDRCIDGFGCPADVAPEDQGDIYLGRMTMREDGWLDEQACAQWALVQLRKQGIKIKKEKGDDDLEVPDEAPNMTSTPMEHNGYIPYDLIEKMPQPVQRAFHDAFQDGEKAKAWMDEHGDDLAELLEEQKGSQ